MFGPATTPCDAGVIQSGEVAARPCPAVDKPWVLAATIVGSSMPFIDGTVVNVALPAIQASLGAAVSEAQWVINGYLLTLGALILVGGAAGDRFGRRRVFVLGIALFTAASVACGLASTATALVIARAVQGIGGALLIPSSLAIISATFAVAERGRAIGTWAGASALTTALGPALGGWLVDTFSWRAIFFVNVPIAALALWLAIRHVPESRAESGNAGLDWRGCILATAGLGALAFGLTDASNVGWSRPSTLIAIGGGIVILALFVWAEARARAPMMPLGLFRSAPFSGVNAMTLLLYFALSGAMFFLPFNFIGIQGYSAAAAGAAFLPFSLIMGGLSRWAGGLMDRFGARLPLVVGPVISAIGYALLALPGIGGSYWSTFFLPMIVLGVGMAISVAPLTTAVMRAVDDSDAGVASGVNNATARVAGLLAVALLGAVAVGTFRGDLDDRLTQLGASAEIRRAMNVEAARLAEARAPRDLEAAQRQVLTRALHQSFVHSFRVVMLLAAAAALLSALCAWLTLKDTRTAPAR